MSCQYWRRNDPRENIAIIGWTGMLVPTLELALREASSYIVACPLEQLPDAPDEDGLNITAMVG